jgi:hypothetical protein
MSQQMRRYFFLDACSAGSFSDRMPHRFGINGPFRPGAVRAGKFANRRTHDEL